MRRHPLASRAPAPAAAAASSAEAGLVGLLDGPAGWHLPPCPVEVDLSGSGHRARGGDGCSIRDEALREAFLREQSRQGAAAAAEQRAAEAAEQARRRQEARARHAVEEVRAEAAAAALAMALPDDLGSSWAAALGVVPAGDVVPLDVLEALAAAERDARTAEARRLALVVALVGPEPSGRSSAERQKAREIALALGMSDTAAEALIHRARMLTGPFDCFGAALAAGQVSAAHCLALIGQTANVVDPDILAAIAEAALPHTAKPVSRFRTQVDALVSALDPDACRRRAAAKAGRRIYKRRDTDGMSFLGIVHQTPVIEAIYAAIASDGDTLLAARTADRDAADAIAADPDVDVEAAERGAALQDGDVRPDACRADAFAARVLGRREPDGTLVWDQTASTVVTLEVVVDLQTLLGLRDGVGLVAGEPVPACTARELAQIATWWRRITTDPVTGVALDYGDRSYLPMPLKKHVFARDGGCRAPSCTRRHRRFLQMDHAEEWPDGHSSAANCGALCRACHRDKTLRLFDITDSRPDGTATFTSAWGQVVRIPPNPYLPPVPARASKDEPLEEPPF